LLVFVINQAVIDSAFESFLPAGDPGVDFVHRLFAEFIASEQARFFHKRTGLIVFTLDEWQRQFNDWMLEQIGRSPDNEGRIRDWCGKLSELLQSSWGIEHGLIVRECLDEEDYNRCAWEVATTALKSSV
jgi:hypothetical protein